MCPFRIVDMKFERKSGGVSSILFDINSLGFSVFFNIFSLHKKEKPLKFCQIQWWFLIFISQSCMLFDLISVAYWYIYIYLKKENLPETPRVWKVKGTAPIRCTRSILSYRRLTITSYAYYQVVYYVRARTTSILNSRKWWMESCE